MPRGEDRIKNAAEQWRNGEPWRDPDVTRDDLMAWWGPSRDFESAEALTTVEVDGDQFTVKEYRNVVGLIDDPEADFNVQSTTFDLAELSAGAAHHGVEIDPEDEEDPAKWMQHAVGYGVGKIAYYGGDESDEWTDTLPDER